MAFFNIQVAQLDKPNRVSDEKDEEYHLKWAKFAISSVYSGPYHRFLEKVKLNRSFYMGGDRQWQVPEDVESFLTDDTNQARNRIKVVNNIIRPIVEQFRGNANRLQLNGSVKALTYKAITRREEALKTQLFYSNVAFEVPEFKQAMMEKFSIGQDDAETESIFFNTYQDSYAREMNKLLDYIENLNELQQKQIRFAEDLALSGLVVAEGKEDSGHLVYNHVLTEEFFYDPSARLYDLSDSEFMGSAMPTIPTNIYERSDLSQGDMDAIERYTSVISGVNVSNAYNYYNPTNYQEAHRGIKIPVYKVFWRDSEKIEWGFVMSELGFPVLKKINWKGPDNNQDPEYTDADLIEVPDTPKNKKLFGNGKKITRKKIFRYNEVLRYCVFIPSEVLASAESSEQKKKAIKDIVLEHGMYPYQEIDITQPSKVKFPYKCYTWGYVDGEILSPVDDAISPQRFLNRVLSVFESHINMSGGSGPVIDEDTIDPQEAKDGTLERNMKQGKPIVMRTKGRGVPNSIGSYDTTPASGVYGMLEIIPVMRDIVNNSTGVNEPLQGQSTGSDQLVGVTEALIQRGSLMQEPFYKALENLYVQIHQMSATVGKMIYLENPNNLVIATGMSGLEVIQLSKDMMNEHMRAFVQRDNTDDTLRTQANQMLTIFREQGLIDDKIFADLFDRSKPVDVTTAMRQHAAAKIEASKRAAEQEAAAVEEAQVEQDAQLALQENLEAERAQREAAVEIQKANIKADADRDTAIINNTDFDNI